MTVRADDYVAHVDVNAAAGEFKINGTAVSTSLTAAHLNTNVVTTAGTTEAGKNVTTDSSNQIDGVPQAERLSVDPSQKVTWYSDFLGDALPAEGEATAGSGTGNAVAISAGDGGRVSIKSSSADAAFTANASAWGLGGLDWRADSGGLVMEARIQCDDVSEAYIFIGFSDQLQSSGLEQPIFLVAGDIDSDAANACGVCYDVDGTTKQWFHGGVKANTDTTPAYSGAAPTEATYETIRVEVSSAGAVTGYVNGTAIGSAVANAITATTAIAPMIIVANRSANPVTCLVDYVWVQANR